MTTITDNTIKDNTDETLSQETTRRSLRTIPHSKLEDALAMVIGTFMIAFALVVMQEANTLTGGTAGLALVVCYATGISFGVLFWLLNLPFYYLAYKQLGMAMVVKTIIAICLLSVFTEICPMFYEVGYVDPVFATIVANVLFGVGFIILFRHRSSLAGFNILALYLQEKYHISAGKVMMVVDIFVMILSFIYVDWSLVVISILGVVVLNLIIDMNHREDRYIAG